MNDACFIVRGRHSAVSRIPSQSIHVSRFGGVLGGWAVGDLEDTCRFLGGCPYLLVGVLGLSDPELREFAEGGRHLDLGVVELGHFELGHFELRRVRGSRNRYRAQVVDLSVGMVTSINTPCRG
jgi:hypothetical protein